MAELGRGCGGHCARKARSASLRHSGNIFCKLGPPDFVLPGMGASSVFRSLRYAVRSLMGDKGFTITVVLTIAVCIAANTATFAVVNSVLLRPLPVPDARSILLMANRYPKAGADFGYNSASGDYYDRLRDVHVFSEQALFRTNGRTIDIQGTPQRVTGMLATPSLFRLLRVSPAYGRAFSDAEGEPGADQKAILSDGMSRQLFGSPEAALGRDVRMSGQPFTVVGVMPAGFNFIDPDVRLWMPAAFTPEQREVHHSNNWQNIGRLKPGATLAAGAVPGGCAQPRQPRSLSEFQGTAGQRGLPHRGGAAGRHAGEGGPRSALPALGRSGVRAADRRGECGQPGAGANHPAAQGVRHPPGTGRRRGTPDAPVGDGEHSGGAGRWRGGGRAGHGIVARSGTQRDRNAAARGRSPRGRHGGAGDAGDGGAGRDRHRADPLGAGDPGARQRSAARRKPLGHRRAAGAPRAADPGGGAGGVGLRAAGRRGIGAGEFPPVAPRRPGIRRQGRGDGVHQRAAVALSQRCRCARADGPYAGCHPRHSRRDGGRRHHHHPLGRQP